VFSIYVLSLWPAASATMLVRVVKRKSGIECVLYICVLLAEMLVRVVTRKSAPPPFGVCADGLGAGKV
jgi:hypothetical protein